MLRRIDIAPSPTRHKSPIHRFAFRYRCSPREPVTGNVDRHTDGHEGSFVCVKIDHATNGGPVGPWPVIDHGLRKESSRPCQIPPKSSRQRHQGTNVTAYASRTTTRCAGQFDHCVGLINYGQQQCFARRRRTLMLCPHKGRSCSDGQSRDKEE